MIDVAMAYNRYKFLGFEFLTWLWFVIENDREMIKNKDDQEVGLDIGNRVVIENWMNDNEETITIKGDGAGLEEGMLALKKGAMVTELNLTFKEGDLEWRFNIKGESLGIAGLKVPDTGRVENKEDIEGAILEKVYLYEKVIGVLDKMYQQFIELRVSDEWHSEVIPNIKKWAI